MINTFRIRRFKLFLLLFAYSLFVPFFANAVNEKSKVEVSDTIFTESDTVVLDEVQITAYESSRPDFSQAAPVVRLSKENLEANNSTSVIHSFNTLSGVRFEQRAQASYRISIRGSSLRSPFGVRNIKIYWNGLPLTLPDGTTPFNALDFQNIDDVQVIKGPAGSMYGAGTGGVILLNTEKKKQDQLSLSFGGGSFDTYRFGVEWFHKMQNSSIQANLYHHNTQGHRDHNTLQRTVANINKNLIVSDRQSVNFHLLYSDLQYEIPGGLNESEFSEDPFQARQGSAEQNSSIHQRLLMGGVNHFYSFAPNFSNTTTLYVNTIDFDHPFILDYKKELSFNAGLRTSFTLENSVFNLPYRFIFGGEYLYGKKFADNYGNIDGNIDSIRFSDNLNVTEAFLFQQLELDLTERLSLNIGLSENFLRYRMQRNVDAQLNTTYDYNRNYDAIIVPRAAIGFQPAPSLFTYFSFSSGYSPPTFDELRTNEGSLNEVLLPERGLNYELGVRSALFQDFLNIDGSLFYFNLDETISTFTNEDGVVLFRNAGSTDQYGVELAVSYKLPVRGFLDYFELGHTYNGHFFTYNEYRVNGNDYSGNSLTGVSPHSVSNYLRIHFANDLSLHLAHFYTDEVPLNDANTDFQQSYHLFNAKVIWNLKMSNNFGFSLHAGVENIADRVYSLGNDLNAFGGRYFQPAPGRYFTAGFRFDLNYNKSKSDQ